MSKKNEAVRARDLFTEIHREIPAVGEVERQLGAKLILARNVLRMRLQRGLSQVALATLAGISQPRIAEIENARSNPQLESLERLANALNVTLESLLKAKHATRKRGTSAHATMRLATRGNAGEGWNNMTAVEEVVELAGHFPPTGAGSFRNPPSGRLAVAFSNG